MGEKQSGLWKYFLICSSLIAFIPVGSGCAALKTVEAGAVARRHLEEAERRLAKQDYDGALAQSEMALGQTSDPQLRQKALFQMAIVYSHQGSGRQDHRKAVSIFKTLAKAKPQSPFALYAETWLSLREANANLTNENQELKQVLEKIKQVDIEIEQKRRQ